MGRASMEGRLKRRKLNRSRKDPLEPFLARIAKKIIRQASEYIRGRQYRQ